MTPNTRLRIESELGRWLTTSEAAAFDLAYEVTQTALTFDVDAGRWVFVPYYNAYDDVRLVVLGGYRTVRVVGACALERAGGELVGPLVRRVRGRESVRGDKV